MNLPGLQRKMLWILAACFVLLDSSAPVDGVVVRHDRSLSQTLELGARFPFVGAAGSGSGSLIGPRWVLTAAHVVENFGPFDYRVRLGDREIPVSRVFVHPGREEMPWDRRTDDVALLYLAEPVEGIAPVDLYRGGDELGEMQELGKVGIVVGVGFFGTADRGPQERDGRRRAVTNKIVNVEEYWIQTYFNRPPGGTDLEGVASAGDSGGPLLVERDGKVLLVGVGSYAEYIDAEGDEGSYGTLDFHVRIAPYVDWIDEVMAAVGAGEPVPSEGSRPTVDLQDAAEGLPETPAGTRASAYLEAFNSGSSEAYERFTRLHRTPASLDGATMESRLDAYRQYHQEWGRLRPVRYAIVSPDELFVLVQSDIGELVLGFTVETEPPHRLVSISSSY